MLLFSIINLLFYFLLFFINSLTIFPIISYGSNQTCFIVARRDLSHEGQGPSHEGDDSRERHWRLTASACGRWHPSTEPKPNTEPQAEARLSDRIIGPPFGGGPIDLSLIQSYRNHCVDHVWIQHPRPKMKLVSHGGQILPLPIEPMMRAYVLQLRHGTLLQTRASWMSLWRGGNRKPRPSTCLLKRWPSLWMMCHVSCPYLW